MLDFCQEYIDIIKSLESSNDIEKAFSTINEAYLLNQIPQDIFEKAQKVYKDNAENRKLKRVGKPWGKEGQEEGKQEPSKSEEKPLEQHAKEASQGDLERTIKESGDEKLRQAAHAELERRQKEEASQEEEKKTEGNKETGKEDGGLNFIFTVKDRYLGYDAITNIEENSPRVTISEFVGGVIKGKVIKAGQGGYSHYYNSDYKINGKNVKIRVSDHSHDSSNKRGDEYLVSIVVNGDESDGLSVSDDYSEIRISATKNNVEDKLYDFLDYFNEINEKTKNNKNESKEEK